MRGPLCRLPPFRYSYQNAYTLLGTNISHQKSFLKLIFLFPRWDMSVPWRVMLPLIFPTFLILSNTLPFCWIFQPNFFPQQHVPRRKISRHKEARPCSWREPHWNLRFASSAGMRGMYHPQPQINRPKKQPAFLSPHLPVPLKKLQPVI